MATHRTSANRASAYLRRSDEYWLQAKELFALGHLEKTGELAWGAVAERIKALALVKTGKTLRHRGIREYAKRAASDLKDEAFYEIFEDAEKLHVNFYEFWLDAEGVKRALARIEALLAKVDTYLEGDATRP